MPITLHSFELNSPLYLTLVCKEFSFSLLLFVFVWFYSVSWHNLGCRRGKFHIRQLFQPKKNKPPTKTLPDKQASNLEAYESSPDKVWSLLGVRFAFWFSYTEACLGKSDRLCLLWIYQANTHRKQECLDSRLLVNAQNSPLSQWL